MRALVLAALLCVATSAHAAPWSFDLPAGYTEVPEAGDTKLEQMRAMPNTVSIDAQVYVSPEGNVQLTRMTLLSKFGQSPTRDMLESMERGTVKGAAKRADKHISDTLQFHGDQLDAEQIDEMAGMRVRQRRLYAVDTSNVIHLFTVICAGPADQLAECEQAQQSMVLMLPNQAPLDMTISTPKRKPDRAFLLGQLTGGALVLGLVIWYVVRRRRQAGESG